MKEKTSKSKRIFESCIIFRLNDYQHEYLKRKGNMSEYLRALIQKDMDKEEKKQKKK